MTPLRGLPGRMLVLLQYPLPQHLLSRMMYRLARIRWQWLKNIFIRMFVAVAGVNMDEAEGSDPADYPDFASFFTRRLRRGARPLPDKPGVIASPVDGTLSQIGKLRGEQLLQAKGMSYSAAALLADPSQAARFAGGSFATVYLAPHQYHRVHMPVDGTLQRTIHVPGRLFSVGYHTAAHVPGLFARNERLVCVFDSAAGAMALVMVGAMLVSGIETVWAGEIAPPRARNVTTRDFGNVHLMQGDEMGRFNMGSTVILLFPAQRVEWRDTLLPGAGVALGQTIGERQR